MFTKVSAVELGPLGIRVNCVAPGAIEIERTRLEDPNYARDLGTHRRRSAASAIPSDIAGVVAFLASDAASFVTGQTHLGRWRAVLAAAVGIRQVEARDYIESRTPMFGVIRRLPGLQRSIRDFVIFSAACMPSSASPRTLPRMTDP